MKLRRLLQISDFKSQIAKPDYRKSSGFTLLELVMVITIIVILALAVVPFYNNTVDAAREATLQNNLTEMRRMIDRYAADKGELPQSLQSLVEAGYLRELPVDPMTGQADWSPTYGTDPNLARNANGVTDVRSSSGDTGSNNKPYSEW